MVKKDEKSVDTGSKSEPQTTSTGQEPSQVQSAPNYDEKFRSFEDTITKQGETIKQLEEYVTGSSAVISTIASDPQLKDSFQQSFQRQYGVQGQQQNQGQPQAQGYQPTQNQNADVAGQVNDVVSANRKSVIRDFERSYGIDQMNPDEAKAARGKIATYLGDFGWEVDKLPLTNLRDSLDKAYMGSIGYEKLKEEGKLEGVVAERTNSMGTFGSMSGGAPQTMEQTGELTSKQMEWMKKLRVKDVDGAKKLYQEQDQEKDREKEVEK